MSRDMDAESGSGRKRIVGYCDPLSISPGETVHFMVSSLDGEDFDAALVRLVCGDVSPGGHGFEEHEVASAIDGRYRGERQETVLGSYAEIEAHPFLAGLESLALDACIYPTLLPGRRQVLISCWDAERPSGFALSLDEAGCVTLEIGGDPGGLLRSPEPLPLRRWIRLHAGYDHDRRLLHLVIEPQHRSPSDRLQHPGWEASAHAEGSVSSSQPLLLAAELDPGGRPVSHLNGRLDACTLGSTPGGDPEVRWDFSLDIGSTRITDTGPHGLSGRTVALPARAVPGVRWNGEVHDWRQDRSQYGAIHFHDDDLDDARWSQSCELAVPAALPSGVYALRVRTSSSEDHMPFFVLPGPGAPPVPVAYLASTMTYRAYANFRLMASPDSIFGNGAPVEVPNDRFLLEHPECGLGCYEHHSDGSGVMYSSHRRPVMNLKPKGGLWSFTADSNVTAWLEHTGVEHHVLTDDALHDQGVELLAPYRVLVTGTHPEYWTTRMLDALEAYLDSGGRLMYMGGNGFYWRTAVHPAGAGTIEVRRAEDGTRFWIAEPGEYHHESTGELGGLWRRIGRPPNLLTGVGFAAEGFTTSGHYRRREGWSDPRVEFATEGIPERVVLGEHGTVGGGAAGHEIDRHDLRLGSPEHAVVLASSVGLPRDMLLTKEEHFAMGFPDPESAVRSDVVFFEGPNGGAVFSVGSIAWAGSLATNGYENDVARLSTNVLRRFADPAPFPPPQRTGSQMST